MSIDEANPLGIAVLSLLEERDMHPYEMIQTLRLRKEDQWIKLRTGSLYHQVERLADKGFVEVAGTQQDGNRPPRTTYHLTPAGREALTRWVSVHLTQVENPYLSFSLALGELSTVDPQQAATLLTARRIALDKEIAAMAETIELAYDQEAERIWLLAHEHRLGQLTHERDYIAALVHDIETKELSWPHHR